MKPTKKKKLGERLVERGSLSNQDLESALVEQRGKTILLGDLLLARGLVSKEELAATLTELLGVELVDVSTAKVDREVLKFIPRATAVEKQALPLYRENNKLVVAMANPQNIHFLDQLRFKVGMEISPALAFSDEIIAAIDVWYGKASDAKETPVDKGRVPVAGKAPSAAPTFHAVARSSQELMHQIVSVEDNQ